MTLLELMVVLVIAGLMAAIVPAAVRAFSPRLRLRGAARRVNGTVQWARNAAAVENAPVKIYYDPDENSCWVEREESQHAFYSLPDGVELVRVEMGDITVRHEVARLTAYADGTLDPHALTLRGADGAVMRITYDRLTGLPNYERGTPDSS
jgi:type II secretion system protein H